MIDLGIFTFLLGIFTFSLSKSMLISKILAPGLLTTASYTSISSLLMTLICWIIKPQKIIINKHTIFRSFGTVLGTVFLFLYADKLFTFGVLTTLYCAPVLSNIWTYLLTGEEINYKSLIFVLILAGVACYENFVNIFYLLFAFFGAFFFSISDAMIKFSKLDGDQELMSVSFISGILSFPAIFIKLASIKPLLFTLEKINLTTNYLWLIPTIGIATFSQLCYIYSVKKYEWKDLLPFRYFDSIFAAILDYIVYGKIGTPWLVCYVSVYILVELIFYYKNSK